MLTRALLLTSLFILSAPVPAAVDPTSERPPVTYLDREAHWGVDCRGELGRVAAGGPPDVAALRRCAHIHTAMDRPSCAATLELLADSETADERRRALAAALMDELNDRPLDEGQCAAARQTVK